MAWNDYAKKIEKEKVINKIENIDLEIKHNYQIDNKSLNKIPSSDQCGYTSACMLLSKFIGEASTDHFVEKFIVNMDKDFIENKSKIRKGSIQSNYQKSLDQFLKPIGMKSVLVPSHGTHEEIIDILKSGSPLMASTMLTKSGHFVLISGYDYEENSYQIQDPYGCFDFKLNRYVIVSAKSGDKVLYPKIDFEIAMEKSSINATGEKGFRYIYTKKI